MKEERKTYTFNFNCNAVCVENLIQGYLQGNSFKLIEENGERFYMNNTAFDGFQCFTYNISNQVLTITVWLKNKFSELSVETSRWGSTYRDSLSKLFQEIGKLDNQDIPCFDPNTGRPINTNNEARYDPNTGQPINNNAQVINSFENKIKNNKDKMCTWGLWLSILGLIGSFGGISLLGIYSIMALYFGYQGLSASKNKAIATIIISSASIIILISNLLN